MDPLADQPWLKCPRCGYDVRGLSENRCPECGELFDPAQLRHAFEAATQPSFSELLFEYSGKAILTFLLFIPLFAWSLSTRRFGPVSNLLVIAILGGFTVVWLALLWGFLKRLRRGNRLRRTVIAVAIGLFIVVDSCLFAITRLVP